MITFMRRYRRGLQVGLLARHRRLRGLAVRVRLERLRQGRASRPTRVATVNGESISRRQYQDRYQGYLETYSQSQPRPALARAGRAAGAAAARRGRAGHRGAVVPSAPAPRGWRSPTRSSTPPSTPCASSRTTGASRWSATGASCRSRGVEAEQRAAALPHHAQGAAARRRRRPGRPTPRSSRRGDCGARRCGRRGRWWSWRRWSPRATASDEELAEYLKAHGDEFKQPERRKIAVRDPWRRKDFAPKVSDAEVEKYYTEHVKEFETPRQVHGSPHAGARGRDRRQRGRGPRPRQDRRRRSSAPRRARTSARSPARSRRIRAPRTRAATWAG